MIFRFSLTRRGDSLSHLLFAHSIASSLLPFPGSPVAHAGLELGMCLRMTLILLHLPLQGCSSRHALPHSVYMVVGTKPRALGMLSKPSTKEAPSPDPCLTSVCLIVEGTVQD